MNNAEMMEKSDKVICVRCDKEIPTGIGFTLIPGVTKSEVPCCNDCFNKAAEANKKMLDRLKQVYG